MEALNISRLGARSAFMASIATIAILGAGCGPSNSVDSVPGGEGNFAGTVEIDGSSTVTPILAAIAEEFSIANPDADVTVGTSGTGGGFKRFIAGETDISMASRPIKESEAAELAAKGIEYIEIPIAFDGLTVVINNENTWAENLTVEELNKIWAADSKLSNWSQVRAGFPDVPIKLYGAGTDSGTFDYFTLAINGEEGSSRSDYQASEDDNVLVQGVIGDKGALGYFGYAYFAENSTKMKAVKVTSPVSGQMVAPSEETIKTGTYQPLSRPLFIYVKKSSAENNPTLNALVKYLLSEEGSTLVASTGYVPFPADLLAVVAKHYEDRKTGTRFAGAEVGLSVEDILAAEAKS